MISKLKDPVSGLTHLFGAFLAVICLALMLVTAKGNQLYMISALIFGISLILLYSASATYHLLNVSEKFSAILRRIDHMMIYVLIAGTYTPICLITLKGTIGNILLISIWSTAILGMFLKLVWFNAPRWLSTLFYIIMGWMVVLAFAPIVKLIAPAGIAYLVSGGVLYSIGGVIYALKWPLKNANYFGFHEIFHLFILGGSLCHFLLIYKYVI